MLEKLPFGPHLKILLESSDYYCRCKYSEPFLWLWRQYARQQSKAIRREDRFFRQLLKPLRSRKTPIFDIGANIGWLSKTFLDFSELVVAVEPDVFCQEVLLNRFGRKKAFQLIPKAVSSMEGFMELMIHESDPALNTFSKKWKQAIENGYLEPGNDAVFRQRKVAVTTLDMLIAEYGLPGFIKIDVEGHELEVAKGLSQPIPLIVFEANLPVFWEEAKQIIEILTQLDEAVTFNYSLNFELMLSQYSEPNRLLKVFDSLGKCSLDIVCRMSSYNEFFDSSLSR